MSPPKDSRRWRNRPVVRERDVQRSRWRWILLAWFVAAAAPLTAYMLEQMEYHSHTSQYGSLTRGARFAELFGAMQSKMTDRSS